MCQIKIMIVQIKMMVKIFNDLINDFKKILKVLQTHRL